MSVAALLLALAAQDAAPPPEGPDIVVTAQGTRRCRFTFADRELTTRELKARAAEWAAGVPVRVVASRQRDIRCLSKIAFRLSDYGVRRIVFVTPDEADR